MPNSRESESILAALKGDRNAFRELVMRHQADVYRLAYRFVRSVPDAEDITQDVFVRLWLNLQKYRPEVKLSTWLYTITTNRCLDMLKSAQHKHNKISKSLDQAGLADTSISPDRLMQETELRQAIERLIDHLKPKQQAVFILRDLEGLSPVETSEILDMPAGKIKSNLYYARLKISELLRHFYRERQTHTS